MAIEQEEKLRKKAASQLESLLTGCGIENYHGRKILEVGFKNGLFVDECRKAGLVPTGLEINPQHYEKTKTAMPNLDLLLYDGGAFPIPDASFDLVASFQVLEHVGSVEHILSECIRVLKPGGTMYHICPNYFSFYEGHFNIVWLPFLNKSLGRIYLKMLRRYNPHYENLNLIKPKHLRRIIPKHSGEITIVSLGQNEFIQKFDDAQIEKINQSFLKKLLRLLSRIQPLKRCLVKFLCWARLYYPLILIARKNTPIQKQSQQLQ